MFTIIFPESRTPPNIIYYSHVTTLQRMSRSNLHVSSIMYDIMYMHAFNALHCLSIANTLQYAQNQICLQICTFFFFQTVARVADYEH